MFKKIVFTTILLIFSSSIANAGNLPFPIEGTSTPFPRGTTVIIGNQSVITDSSALSVYNISNSQLFKISTGGTKFTQSMDYEPDDGTWQLEVPNDLADGTYSVTWDSSFDNNNDVYNTTFTFSIGVPIATVTAGTGVVEPISLPSVADTIGEAVDLFDFDISDGVVSDKKSTDVTQIVIHTSGTGDFSKVTWRLNGADASNVVGVYSANDNTITFSGLSISVADITSETYTINGYFNDTANLTDNATYILSVDGDTDLTLDATKTQMGATEMVDNGTGTKVVISDTLPTASSVTLSGTVEVGQTLTGTYTYNDADGDAESGSSFVWYRSDDASGTNKTLIAGATNNTYTLVSADTGKYISFAVIPSNTNGTGLAVESAINGTAVVVAPTVTPPSTGGGSTGGGSTYTPPPAPTPTPEEPEEEEETVEPIVEEEKVVVQPITEPISEPIVVERQTGNADQTGTKPELDNVTKLYIATFGRAPESAGSVYWLYESKLNLEDIARSFFDQEETKEKYPEGYSNYDFIVSTYNHVYDRDPDQEGGDYWLEELDSGKVEKGLFILAVINGAIGDDALMLEKQTIAGVNFVKSGVQNLDMAKKVIDDIQR